MSGLGCNSPKKPTVFTRVSAYIDWMNSVSMKNKKCVPSLYRKTTVLMLYWILLLLFPDNVEIVRVICVSSHEGRGHTGSFLYVCWSQLNKYKLDYTLFEDSVFFRRLKAFYTVTISNL